MPHQERPAKTGRKCGLRLGHADLSAGYLRRVAADEVIHRLGVAKPANRRQHTERVAGQKDYIAWMARDARNLGVADELDRISAARILGDTAAMKIDVMGHLVIDDILQHRAESQRLIYLRLRFGCEMNRLGVAAALDIEDAV